MNKIGMRWTTEIADPYTPMWDGEKLHLSYWKSKLCPVHGWEIRRIYPSVHYSESDGPIRRTHEFTRITIQMGW